LHTTDSAVVQQELSKLWPNKFANPIQQLTQNFEFGKVRLPAISCIKYISRRHGLPKNVLESLLNIICLDDDKFGFLKYQIAQSLKYTIEREEAALVFPQLLSALHDILNIKKSGDNAKHGVEPYVNRILSQLVETIAVKLNAENCEFDHNEKQDSENWIVSQIKPYFPYIDPRSKMLFLDKAEKLGIYFHGKVNSGSANSSVTANLTGLDFDVETKGRAAVSLSGMK